MFSILIALYCVLPFDSRRKLVGNEKVEFPCLRRHLTMGYVFEEYRTWCNENGITTLGRTKFHHLLRLLTEEIKEITGASYYYTEGIIDTFKVRRDMIQRVHVFAGSDFESGM